MPWSIRFGALTFATLPLLAACGGAGSGGASGSTSLTAYAHKICSAVSGPIAVLKTDATAYAATANRDKASGLPAIKADTEHYFAEVVAQFRAIRDGVAGAGTPEVSRGTEIRSKLSGGFGQLVSVAAAARSDVARLNTANPEAFVDGLEADGQKLQAASSSVGTQLDAVTDLGGSDLEQAFAADPTCKTLSSG